MLIYLFVCLFLILYLVTQWLLLVSFFFLIWPAELIVVIPSQSTLHVWHYFQELSATFQQLVNADPKDHIGSCLWQQHQITNRFYKKFKIASQYFTKQLGFSLSRSGLPCHVALQQLSSAEVCMDFHWEDKGLQLWNSFSLNLTFFWPSLYLMASTVWLIALLVSDLCKFYFLYVRKKVYVLGEINSLLYWHGVYPPVIIYASEVWGGCKGCLTARPKVLSDGGNFRH